MGLMIVGCCWVENRLKTPFDRMTKLDKMRWFVENQQTLAWQQLGEQFMISVREPCPRRGTIYMPVGVGKTFEEALDQTIKYHLDK